MVKGRKEEWRPTFHNESKLPVGMTAGLPRAGISIAQHKQRQRCYRDRARLFSAASVEKRGGSDDKLHQGNSAYVYSMGVGKHWNKLSKKMMKSASLQIFRTWQGSEQSALAFKQALLWAAGWTKWSSEIFSSLHYSTKYQKVKEPSDFLCHENL